MPKTAFVSDTLKSWIDESNHVCFFGVPVTEFDRDELIGCIHYLMREQQQIRQDHDRSLTFMRNIMRARHA